MRESRQRKRATARRARQHSAGPKRAAIRSGSSVMARLTRPSILVASLLIVLTIFTVLAILRSRPSPFGIATRFDGTGTGSMLGSNERSDVSVLGADSPPEQLIAATKQVADELVRRFPGNPHVLTVSGRIFQALGDGETAFSRWEQALEIDPNFAATHHALGEWAWEQGNFARAAGHLRRAIEMEPAMASGAVYLLADSLMKEGEPGAVVQELTRAEQNERLAPNSLILLSQALIQLSEYGPAKARLEQVLALESDSVEAHFTLAALYARLDQPEKAALHREEYARLKSDNLAETSRLRNVRRDRDFSDMRPIASQAHVHAGKIHALQGDFQEAERLWRRAARISPENPEPSELLRMLRGGN